MCKYDKNNKYDKHKICDISYKKLQMYNENVTENTMNTMKKKIIILLIEFLMPKTCIF